MDTLQKLMFLHRVKSASGGSVSWETISGTLPLTLLDAAAKPIKSLIRYGRVAQDGTPTPESPVNIVCNNGVVRMVDDELPNGYDTTHLVLRVVGTPEVLTVSGNLLSRDGETRGKIITAGGVVSENANYSISAPFVLPAGNYTCTWQTGSGSRPFSVFAVDESGTPQSDGKLFYQQSAASGINTGEFTVEAKTLAVASYRNNATGLAIYSTTQTASVANLYAVGDYKDEQDLISGAVTRRVGVKVFDGTEAFTISGTAFRTAELSDKAANTKVICSHFNGDVAPSASVSSMPDLSVKGYGQNEAIFFKYSAITTVDDWKAFLAEQYAAGTPVIVLYPLADGATESVTPQQLTTIEGTNTVSTVANVGGLDGSCEYAFKSSGSIVGTATVGTAVVG